LDSSLLSTKLFIPKSRKNLVPRPRLFEKINIGQDKKITLISAPAGFGKSTLLSNWVRQSEEDIVWVSLDETDNGPTRFLTYFIAALNQSDGTKTDFGRGLLSILRSPQPPPVADIMTSLINEISSLPGKITLVLDDYHLIREPLIDESLIFLLEHQPQNFHLIIATRDDPQLPLAGLRAKGQLAELRAADLRFSSTETAEFLNKVMGLALSSDDIDALESRTEGWIAGLQLAAISLQGLDDPGNHIKSFTGSHRFVMDYLIEEVLEKQSESVQRFLLETAILDRMTGSLCDALTGEQNGQKTLEMLDNENLFIVPLDNERRWYRYHRLFADLLRQRLNQTQQLPILHRSASEWYEQNGFVDEAIEYALRSQDLKRALDLIEPAVEPTWQRGEHKKIENWMRELPHEEIQRRPQLCIFYAWNLFAKGKQDEADAFLRSVEKELGLPDKQGEKSKNKLFARFFEEDRKTFYGRAETMRSFMASYRSDAAGITRHAKTALEYLPESDKTWINTASMALGEAYVFTGNYKAAFKSRKESLQRIRPEENIYLYLNASMKLALNLRAQGRFNTVIQTCKKSLHLAEDNYLSNSTMAGWVLAIWGETLAEINDLNQAEQFLTKGVELTEIGDDVAMYSWSLKCLARVMYSTHNLEGVNAVIMKAKELMADSVIPRSVIHMIETWQVRLWLQKGQIQHAKNWVEENGISLDLIYDYVDGVAYITFARVLIAQEQFDEAITLLNNLYEQAEPGEHIERMLSVLILKSITLHKKGDSQSSIDVLLEALDIGKRFGYCRIFIDEGPNMESILREIRINDDDLKKYIRKLLSAFKNDRKSLFYTDQPLVEPLSERELELLALIARGLTNKQIAAQLFLSQNTVKSHTRNIYQKLSVNSRTQAIASAKSLNIL